MDRKTFINSSGRWAILGGLLANLIQTDFGNVTVKDVRFAAPNGRMYSGLLYIPDGVTPDAPAPGILAIHGYINTRETQDGFSIEFARRGYVVLALDQSGHGYSEGPAFADGFGGIEGMRYLKSLTIVDQNNVGLEGHSMGGWAVVIAAAVFPDGYKSMVLEGSSTGTYGAPDGTPEFPRNLAVVFSQWDEFAGLMWLTPKATDAGKTDKMKAVFNTTEDIEVGKVYGDIAAGTARVLYQPKVVHPGDHISQVAIGHAVDWFQKTLVGGNNIPADQQTWYWKEIGTLVAMVGFFIFLVAVGGLLLTSTGFSSIADPLPAAASAPSASGGFQQAHRLPWCIPRIQAVFSACCTKRRARLSMKDIPWGEILRPVLSWMISPAASSCWSDFRRIEPLPFRNCVGLEPRFLPPP